MIKLVIIHIPLDFRRRPLRSGFPRTQAALEAMVRECASDADKDLLDELGFSEWFEDYRPDGLQHVVLLSVGWEAWGSPMGGGASIEALLLMEHAYVYVPSDPDGGHDLVFLGAMSVPLTRETVSELLRDKVVGLVGGSETDEGGSWAWYCRLPTSTTNDAPELVERAAIHDAYREVLTYGQVDVGELWEPLMKDVAHLAGQEWLVQYIGKRSVDEFLASSVPDDVRAREDIFEAWFEHSYRERPD